MQWRRHGPWFRRALTIGLLLGGLALWVHHLRAADWHGMLGVIGAMPAASLLAAMALAAASYAVYAGFDLLGRRVTRSHVNPRRLWAIGLVSHAFALNLGPAGIGLRLRLYTRHGIDAAVAAALWVFNVATNWIGFVVLAGLAFASRSLSLPRHWGSVASASRPLGFALLALVLAYVLACAMAHGRSWTVLGRRFTLPSPGVALMQCLSSVLNWALLAGVLTALMQHRVEYAAVLGALMTSALALAIVDVPGGLGVIEAVFVALLGSQMPAAELLAALLAYRAIYFIGPLIAAMLAYLALEFDADAHRARSLNPPGRSQPVRFPASARGVLAPPARRPSSGSPRSRP